MSKKGCLTCKYAVFGKRSWSPSIDCNSPIPKKIPALYKYTSGTIECDREEEDNDYKPIYETAKAYVCHDEYYDEGEVSECPCWEKRPRKINIKKYIEY